MDFYKDNDQSQICQIFKMAIEGGLEIPDYVLSKQQDDPEIPKLANLSFADAENRNFPMHTKADTWLSAAFSSLNGHMLQKSAKARVKSMIHKGADLWDISPETIAAIDRTMAMGLQKKAAEEADTTPREEDFPTYCEQLVEKLPSMDYTERRDLCQQVLKTASEYGLEIPPQHMFTFETGAGQGVNTKKDVLSWLIKVGDELSRADVDTANYVEACKKEVFESDQDMLHPSTLTKIATVMDLAMQATGKVRTKDDLAEAHLFSITDSLMKTATETHAAIHDHVIAKTAIESKFDTINENLKTLVGDSATSVNELVARLNGLAPMTADKILRPIQ